jgi:hypothetical protein
MHGEVEQWHQRIRREKKLDLTWFPYLFEEEVMQEADFIFFDRVPLFDISSNPNIAVALPSQKTCRVLVEYFQRPFTKDLESIFLKEETYFRWLCHNLLCVRL